jgi:3',5'-cyclic AMP phosphodiesterase CpdA
MVALPALVAAGVIGQAQAATEPAAPLPFVPGSETLVLLPDTQNYSEFFPAHFTSQTRWIVDNAQARNIRMVLQLGDVTNNNRVPEWENAKRSLDLLRGKVPFAFALGNHDLGEGGRATSRDTLANRYFPLPEYRRDMNVIGTFEPDNLANMAHTFRIADRNWLVLNLEFGPRDAVIRWADDMVRKHPRHQVILMTHAYLYSDDTRYDHRTRGYQHWNPHAYGIGKLAEKPNDGEELWDKLVRKHRSFAFVFNGHVLNDGVGRQTSRGDRGNLVHQHLVNYQMLPEGGQGYLRLVEFLPDGRTVQFRSYSPSLDQYKTDDQNQFIVDLRDGTVRTKP